MIFKEKYCVQRLCANITSVPVEATDTIRLPGFAGLIQSSPSSLLIEHCQKLSDLTFETCTAIDSLSIATAETLMPTSSAFGMKRAAINTLNRNRPQDSGTKNAT